jgi:hypothetical protein
MNSSIEDVLGAFGLAFDWSPSIERKWREKTSSLISFPFSSPPLIFFQDAPRQTAKALLLVFGAWQKPGSKT